MLPPYVLPPGLLTFLPELFILLGLPTCVVALLASPPLLTTLVAGLLLIYGLLDDPDAGTISV